MLHTCRRLTPDWRRRHFDKVQNIQTPRLHAVLPLRMPAQCCSHGRLAGTGVARRAWCMAPKARTLPTNDRPSVQEVRTAVRHLLELAAAAEGLGLELGELAVSNSDDARTLNSVVRLLLNHRARQRDAQRDSVHVHLVEQLRDTYRRARAEG